MLTTTKRNKVLN